MHANLEVKSLGETHCLRSGEENSVVEKGFQGKMLVESGPGCIG